MHRLLQITKQPQRRCANIDCNRPCSDDSESGLCHNCCRQTTDPTPEEISAIARETRIMNLVNMVSPPTRKRS